MGLATVSGRSPGGGNGNPLKYSCLKNLMDRGARWAAVHGITESDMTEYTHSLSLWQMRILRFTWTDFLGIQYLLHSKPILESRKLLWLDSWFVFQGLTSLVKWTALFTGYFPTLQFSGTSLPTPNLVCHSAFCFYACYFSCTKKGTVNFSSFLWGFRVILEASSYHSKHHSHTLPPFVLFANMMILGRC